MDLEIEQKRSSEEVLRELEQLLANARPVPLTDQVRLNPRDVRELVAELRQAIESERRW